MSNMNVFKYWTERDDENVKEIMPMSMAYNLI